MKNKHISGTQFTTLSCLTNRVLYCVKTLCRVKIVKGNVVIKNSSIKRKEISIKIGDNSMVADLSYLYVYYSLKTLNYVKGSNYI